MRYSRLITWFVLGAAASLAAAALMGARKAPSALPFFTETDLTPRWISPGSREYERIHRVADWTLTDQTGGRVSAADLDGTIYVAAFFFTTCRGFCPLVRSNLAAVARAFRDDSSIRILSHTVTPDVDNAGVLAAYAATNGIHAPQWRLLTGDAGTIAALAKASYFVQVADSAPSTPAGLLHSETLVLVDGDRRIRGLYDGTLRLEIDRLIDDVRVLERNRAEAGVGVPRAAPATGAR
ncbi:MAG TPA: SCO family protein [Gemmatimonadaceae bacterium]|nr:SCO family protein [Gemmatimonadaceae bacterium]